MHDPSTVIEASGKFDVYGTGNRLPAFESDDGWAWRCASAGANGRQLDLSESVVAR
jgi:hypothetical protein